MVEEFEMINRGIANIWFDAFSFMKARSLKFKVQSSMFPKCRLSLLRKRFVLFFLFLFSFFRSSFAQPKDISSSELLHRIEGLKNTATVLYIAAHPDDENTRLISYLEKEKHYRVAYLSLTRGEGGQNLIGTEQGMDLGILRTQELLAARKIDGAEQFFSTAYDFGYSKSSEETMKKWGRKKIVSDIVNVMNYFQPDIVICRFPTTGEGGHGHHTASAILAEEAFDSLVRANGNYVPKKLFWNTFNFGSRNTTNEDQLKIDVGGYNALLGKSYGEIAAEARSMHRSQGFGSERKRGEQFEYFKVLRGDAPKSDLMEGIKTDWSRFKGGEAINKKIDEIIKNFDFNDPSKSINDLLKLKEKINELYKVHHVGFPVPILTEKVKEINELILDCAGIYLEFTSINSDFTIQDSVILKLQAINRSDVKVDVELVIENLIHEPLDSLLELPMKLGKNINIIKQFTWKEIYSKYHYSFPYPIYVTMSESDPEIVFNKLSKYPDIMYNLPEFRPYQEIIVVLKINDREVNVMRNLSHKIIDPSFGERLQPVFDAGTDVMKHNFIRAEIKYDHIPTQIYYKKKEEPLKFDYLKFNQKKIGYISGAGDKIPDILSQIGYEVTLLDESNFSTFKLSSFDCIVTGVRAYNTQSWLGNFSDRLLNYVEGGGNLIIQYNTSRGLAAEIPKPYPFELSRDRVTEEESEVVILDTNASILNYPNKIHSGDFTNWIQEYGLYFPTEVDSNYKKLLSMHDTGESPNENSLIYCNYGKGKYVYTGLSFFRELPAGISGATKLFVNIMEDNIAMTIKKSDLEKIPSIENGVNMKGDGHHVPDKRQKTKSK